MQAAQIADSARITAGTAVRLGRYYFGTTEMFWLNLQKRYDLEVERLQPGAAFDRIVALVSDGLPWSAPPWRCSPVMGGGEDEAWLSPDRLVADPYDSLGLFESIRR